MKVKTINSNEEYVRLRIFDGELPISEAVNELIRLEREQHAATRHELERAYDYLTNRC